MREIKKQFARTLRKRQTPAERKVWNLLKSRGLFGLKFRRQHVIEGFVVDFYCHEQRLAIEVDGGYHQRRKEYDEDRQAIIESKARVIRVNNEDVERDCVALIRKIKEAIKPKA